MPRLEVCVFLGLLCICLGLAITVGILNTRRRRDQ